MSGVNAQSSETIEQVAAERDKYRNALESFRTMQGEVFPIYNDEFVRVSWILEVVERALTQEPPES